MLDREIEELRARIVVLERLVVMLAGELYVDAQRRGQDGRELAAKDLATWHRHLARATFPGLDPALADLRAAEVEKAASEILRAVADHVGLRLAT